MIRKQYMTADELLAMPKDGYRYELVRGELIKMSPAGFWHGCVGMKLAMRIGHYVETHKLGVVLSADTGFTLERDPDTVLAPDASFVQRNRIPPRDEQVSFAALAPDLAVEVLSPNDRPGAVRAKIDLYLQTGVRLLWVVDPKRQVVREYRPEAQEKTYTTGDMLDGKDVLPGFSCAVAELFRE